MVYIVLDSETIQIHISSFYDISATILVSYQTIDLQYDTGFNRESWLAKIKYTQKKNNQKQNHQKATRQEESPGKKSKQKQETQKTSKNNTNINQNMDFPQCFFFCIFCILSLLLWFVFSVCSEFGFSLFYYLNCVKPYILYAVGLIILWYKLI